MAEAKQLAGLHHRSLNRLIDAGSDEDGNPCAILQTQEGVSMQRILSTRHGHMEELLALLIVRSVAQCLEVIHDAGLVHGHINPACIRLLGRQQIHLSYCLPASINAAVIGEEQPPLNLFRPPEGGAIGPAHDIYALGVCALSALAPSCLQLNDPELIERCRSEGPAQLIEDKDHISAGARQFLTCVCDPDPAKRYNTIGDLVADVTDVIAGQRARHADRMQQEQQQEEEDEGRRSNFFNTADIQAHLAKEAEAKEEAKEDGHDSAKMEVLDKEMLAVIAKLVVVTPDQQRAYINLAPGTAFPRYLLEAVLDTAKVTYGRVEANIIKATRPSDAIRRLEIARGRPPRPGVPGTNVHGGETLPLMKDISVEIAPDAMEAWLHSVPAQPVPLERIQEVAAKNGIEITLLPQAVDLLTTTGHPEGRCLIARGDPPADAIASRFLPSKHDVLDQQSIDDFLKKGSGAQEIPGLLGEEGVRMVKHGECLAVWRQGTHPRDGTNVFGKRIPAKDAAHPSAAACAGEGTELHRNKKNLIFLRARRNGAMQILDDGTVRVVGVSESSPLDLEDGKVIESDDLLIINGDVPDGTVIHANGGLIVHGSVGDAQLHVGGDCIIDGEISAGDREIQCAGQMHCAGIDSRNVIANTLVATGQVRHCTVTVLGDCQVGHAVGGQIIAAGNIVVGELGDDDGTETQCWAGHHVPMAVKRSMAKLDEKRLRNERLHMLSERDDMREMIENIARTQYRFNVGGWMGKDYLKQLKDRIDRIKLRSACIDDSLERARHMIVDKVEEIEDIQDQADNTKAYVKADRVHTRVIVKLADSETRSFEHGQDDLDYRMHEPSA